MISEKYIPGSGNPHNPKILILGEAPSYDEVMAGKCFVGPSGRELDKLLKEAGINRDSCWVTNVCKFMVTPQPKSGKKIPFEVRAKNDGIDLSEQYNILQTEINELKPNVILALGGTALKAVTGKNKISEFRGSILTGMGRKVVATYHPAHLLHQAGGEIKGYYNRQVMILDMIRARQQSEFPELRLPNRLLSICKSSGQLYDFIERYKDHRNPAIDIEAGGHCIPICIGIAYTPGEGLTVPLWNRDDISSIPSADLVQCWILLSNLLANDTIVGQNFKYDQDKIKRLGFIIKGLHSDVMLKSFAINPELPKRLAFNQSIYTEEPFYKDEGMYEGSVEDLFIGCARDACVTKEIDLLMDKWLDKEELRPYYEQFLLPLHNLYLEIEETGMDYDIEAQKELLKDYIEWDERLRYEMFKIVGTPVNANSPKQISSILFDNFKIPRRQGTGEEELTAILNSAKLKDEHREFINKVLTSRRVRKTVSTYILALPDFDGKMRSTFFICNETGRTSTGQQEPPIRPKVEVRDEKNKKKLKDIGIAFQTITKHGDIGPAVRKAYKPPPNWVFMEADSAQAEARVVFLLANDEEALTAIDTRDYHAYTASWFFGGTEEDYSKKVLGYESPIRFIGKTLRHACHLGASGKRAAITVNTDAKKYKIDITITEVFANRAIEIFHKTQPSIRQVFHEGIVNCLRENKRVLTAPLPYGIKAPFGGKRRFFERDGDELYRQAYSYIPQRAITDNTKGATLRIRSLISRNELKIHNEAHDGLLFSMPETRVDDFAPIIKQEMERPIDFSNCSLPRRSLIVPCEQSIGYNYLELKKYKVKV